MHARSGRFPLFDSLRAIAAISVLAAHAAFLSGYLDVSNTFRQYAARLDVGVAVFFLISGFLLYRPFVAARMRPDRQPATLPYAWRRFLRIVPAYWLALTVIAVWLGLGGVFTAAGIPIYYGLAQIYSADYVTGGIVQAWTLCVEVAFYAFLPLYALAMRALPARSSRGRYLTEWAGLAALFLIAFGWQAWRISTAGDPDHANAVQGLLYLPAFLDQFALGMGLAVASVLLADRDALPGVLRPLDRFPSIGLGLALVAFWAASTQLGLDGRGGLTEPTTAAQYFGRHYLFALVGFGLLLPVVFGDQRRGIWRKILAHPVLLYLGLVSYGIYLWQVGVIEQFSRWDLFRGGLGPFPAVAVWFVLGLLAATATASISYWVMERPLLRLKRLLPARRPMPGEPAEPGVPEPGPLAVEDTVPAPPGRTA
jgi:peptidoglycan/LPS O-acetylase OafA/YrhL